MKLDKQTQDHKPLESLDTRVKLSKELFENGDIEEVYQSLSVFIYFYDILSESV